MLSTIARWGHNVLLLGTAIITITVVVAAY
jgi:hypothetical protein